MHIRRERERERECVSHTHTRSISVQHSNSGNICFLNVVVLNKCKQWQEEA